MSLKIKIILFDIIILFFLIINICIFNPNISSSNYKKVYTIPNLNASQDEWTDVQNKFYFRTQTAQYLQDEKRIHILMMNNQDFYLNFDFIFRIELFYDSKTNNLIQLNNIMFNTFIKEMFYEDLELTAPFSIDNYVDSKKISDLSMILKILIYEKNSSNLFGSAQPIKVNIKNWLPPARTKDIYICTKDIYLEPSDYKNFEWWIDMNVRNEFTKIVIMNNSIPDTAEFRHLFNVYKDKVDVINYNKLPNLMNVSQGVKYFSHVKELIFGEDRSKIHKYGAEYMSFHECIFRYSDKADLILLIDPDEIFIPVKLDKFENELVTYELVKGLNLADENYFNFFKQNILNQKNCKTRVRFNMYNDFSYLRNYIDNVYATNSIPVDYSIFFQTVAFIKKDFVDAIFDQLNKEFKAYNETRPPNYPIKVI